MTINTNPSYDLEFPNNNFDALDLSPRLRLRKLKQTYKHMTK